MVTKSMYGVHSLRPEYWNEAQCLSLVHASGKYIMRPNPLFSPQDSLIIELVREAGRRGRIPRLFFCLFIAACAAHISSVCNCTLCASYLIDPMEV